MTQEQIVSIFNDYLDELLDDPRTVEAVTLAMYSTKNEADPVRDVIETLRVTMKMVGASQSPPRQQDSIVHKATPESEDAETGASHCTVCGRSIKRVPGGQGPTWIHNDTATVAARSPRQEI